LQIRLEKKNGTEKRKEKAFKWTIFLIISFFANVFLAYLISSDKLLLMIEEGRNHVSTLISLLILQEFSILFLHGFREQFYYSLSLRKITRVLDDKSINVAYDFIRGEKKLAVLNSTNKRDRAILERRLHRCKQCVNVCPTRLTFVMGHKWNVSIVPLVDGYTIQLWIALFTKGTLRTPVTQRRMKLRKK
jgi:hypothetical protein